MFAFDKTPPGDLLIMSSNLHDNKTSCLIVSVVLCLRSDFRAFTFKLKSLELDLILFKFLSREDVFGAVLEGKPKSRERKV